MRPVCHLSQFLVLILLVNNLTANAQPVNCPLPPNQNIFWNSLSDNGGLSQNSITAIIQDTKGFIWIGTYDGLNRFDGFSTLVKRHESNNPASLSDNRVLSLSADKSGNILIGTDGGGLNIYDPSLNITKQIDLSAGTQGYNVVNSVCSDSSGNIWAGTDVGICIISPSAKGSSWAVKHLAYFPRTGVSRIICDSKGNIWAGTATGLFILRKGQAMAEPVTAIGSSAITALYQDDSGYIWIGQRGGLFSASLSGTEINLSDQYSIFFRGGNPQLEITDISKDRSGTLWIATRSKGIFSFKIRTDGKFEPAKLYNSQQPYCNLLEDMVNVLFTDASNTLWVGTYRKGVNYYNMSANKFSLFAPVLTGITGKFGYQGKFVTAVSKNNEGLWIGTDEDGLLNYNACSSALVSYTGKDKIDAGNIICLYSDNANSLWVGTNMGLYHQIGRTRSVLVKPGVAIRSICGDRFGRIWLCSWDGVMIFDPATGKTDTITRLNGLSTDKCFTLYADPVEQVIWVGTIGGGLNSITYNEMGTVSFRHYLHDAGNEQSLSNNNVWCIFRENKNRLLVGTDAGLNICPLTTTPEHLNFTRVSNPELKDRKITAILEGSDDDLWLSSSLGLVRYNLADQKLKHYTYRDGLQSNSFTEAAFKDEDGVLYFGGINGLNYFQPDKIIPNPFPATVSLTDFKVFNESIIPNKLYDGEQTLTKDINSTNRIVLSHRQNNFMLVFAALHFAVPEENKFRYKLEGYDRDWIVAQSDQRFAAYSNLDAGTYTFLIMASNNDNLWTGETKKVEIVIQPAPWLSPWAKLVYGILAVLILWLVYKRRLVRNQLKTQLYLEKIEKEKITELNEMKLTFFTNISHELRTPLNLITGPVRELIGISSKLDRFVNFRLNIIQRNSLRLLELINQILDLRKISGTTQDLSVTQVDLTSLINDIIKSFGWIADQRNIDVRFNYSKINHLVWCDQDKVQKIVFNLLSNAFNHTETDGKIIVATVTRDLQAAGSITEISVTDSGTGIPDTEIAHVFDLFYQGKQQKNTGSGIGLNLAKRLAELHKGSLVVQSKLGEGAAFIFSFPGEKSGYDPAELKDPVGQPLPGPATRRPSDPQPAGTSGSPRKKRILIVEDEEDQFSYMQECLGDEFEIDRAPDGQTGLNKALKTKPELILTDIMMPGMSGIELSRKLKENASTRHIPVIIHSVKNTSQTIRQAFESGAEDIITKPYDYNNLKVKINNIILSRTNLIMNGMKDDLIQPADVNIPSDQEDLIKSVLKIVEENMTDPEFSVDKLAKLSAMSRMSLHRKLHAITGKTASEIIREIRMKRAAQLLQSGSKRITEVMYEVGISSNFHFNKYFRELYGMTPKDYIKTNGKKTDNPPG
ncbi:MAG: response regulator [Chitinophagaceae bacterium]|nr:MAG: response regulator [Chitinophagaceae bacterium]